MATSIVGMLQREPTSSLSILTREESRVHFRSNSLQIFRQWSGKGEAIRWLATDAKHLFSQSASVNVAPCLCARDSVATEVRGHSAIFQPRLMDLFDCYMCTLPLADAEEQELAPHTLLNETRPNHAKASAFPGMHIGKARGESRRGFRGLSAKVKVCSRERGIRRCSNPTIQ